LAWFGLIWALVICGKLVWLQVLEHDSYLNKARIQQFEDVELRAARGTFFDRRDERLVVSLSADSLTINPRKIPNPEVAAQLLALVLHMDEGALLAKIHEAQGRNRGFLPIKKKLTSQESEQLRAFDLEWMEFEQKSDRVYLNGAMGSNLIGSVDHAEKGNAGLELLLQRDLEGKPGRMRELRDSTGRRIDSVMQEKPRPGMDIALTIDERLQFIADERIKRAVEEHRARSGTITAMDPVTGEILAMSNYPTFDPQSPVSSAADLRNQLNRAVAEPFEPGSVMKIFTISAAMAATDMTPQTIINCGGGVMPWFGRIVHDSRGEHFTSLPVEGVLWHSSNVGALNIGRRVGAATLYEYFHDRFGFGMATGLGLPGESSGLLNSVKRWTPGSIGYISFGHEIGVTNLQLARAVSVIANGGLLVQPKVVRWKQRPGGVREVPREAPKVRTLAPETAIEMRRMMEGVILNGTGKSARIPGFTAGGKTGTAQIYDFEAKRYEQSLYNSSFVGFAPLTNPRVVVVVTLIGVRGMAAAVAAPVFKDVTTAALRFQGVPRDLPEVEEPVPSPVSPPNAPAALRASEETVEPEPAVAVDPSVLLGPKVPDFRGATLNAVVKRSLELGVKVELVGSGLARSQDPPAGSVLARGKAVRVFFSSGGQRTSVASAISPGAVASR